MFSFRCREPRDVAKWLYDFDTDCCAGSNTSVSPGLCANGFTRTETTPCGYGNKWCDANGCNEYTCKLADSCVEYVGCYGTDEKGDPDLPFKATEIRAKAEYAADYQLEGNVSTCSNYCRKNNFSFAALQGAETCWCGDSYGTYGRADERLCGEGEKAVATRCGDGDTDTCAGVNAVYRLTGQSLVHLVRLYRVNKCPAMHHRVK